MSWLWGTELVWKTEKKFFNDDFKASSAPGKSPNVFSTDLQKLLLHNQRVTFGGQNHSYSQTLLTTMPIKYSKW